MSMMPRDHTSRVRVALVTLLSLVAAACGSTVQQARPEVTALNQDGPDAATVTDDLGPADGLRPGGGATHTSPPTSSGGAIAGGLNGDPSGSAGPAPAGSATAPSAGGAASPSVPPPGEQGAVQGDTSPIEVGLLLVANNAAAASALGVEGIDNGDEQAVAQILVDHVNAGGGLGGRQLTPVVHLVDPSSGADTNRIGQEACATFTEDHAVELVISKGVIETLNSCLEGRGVPVISSQPQQGPTREQTTSWPHLVVVNAPELEALAATYPAALIDRGFFDGSAATGVVTIDNPQYRPATDTFLVPTLEAAGVDVRAVHYSPDVIQISDAGAVVTAAQNAVLQFRTQGVDRVLFLENASIHSVSFMQSADSQGYYPIYGFNSSSAPQFSVDTIGPRPFAGAVGMGWDQHYDVAPSGQTAPPAGRQACLDLLATGGQDLEPSSNAAWIATMLCDGILFADAVAEVAGGISLAGVPAGAAALGHSFSSAVTFGTRFAPDRRAGVAAYRHTSFDQGCSCFTYVSDDRPF